MAKSNLMQYAIRGARARIAELQQELDGIYREFPTLRRQEKDARAATGYQREPSKRRTRAPMTAAQKRAVSARMTKYWADRRKAKAAK